MAARKHRSCSVSGHRMIVNGPGLGNPESLDDARSVAAGAYGDMLGDDEGAGVQNEGYQKVCLPRWVASRTSNATVIDGLDYGLHHNTGSILTSARPPRIPGA